jgi:hypothetical protein
VFTPASNAHLKLVHTDDETRAAWARERQVRQQIIRENRAAADDATLDPRDPRWVVAARAHAQLDGSAMTPEARRRVMRTASALGVRPFDANVIIAIVQDHARRGEPLGDAVTTLRMLQRPPAGRETMSMTLRWLAAIATAGAATALLVRWLVGSV